MGKALRIRLLCSATIAVCVLGSAPAFAQNSATVEPYATEDLAGPHPGAFDPDLEEANVDFVSDDGTIVYSQIPYLELDLTIPGNLGPEPATVWTKSTGLFTIRPVGALSTAVQGEFVDINGVSRDGQVAVGVSYNGDVTLGAQAFVFTLANRTTRGLGFLPGASSLPIKLRSSGAVGVSADGSVVAGYSSYGLEPGTPSSSGLVLFQAFRWTAADGMTGLGFLAGNNQSQATAISADGTTIVGRSFSGQVITVGERAFRWTASGGMQGLGPIAGITGNLVESGALRVSPDGGAILGYLETDSSTARNFFHWTATGGAQEIIRQIDSSVGILGSSADLNVVFSVQAPLRAGPYHIYRWTPAGGNIDLGALPNYPTVTADFPSSMNATGSIPTTKW